MTRNTEHKSQNMSKHVSTECGKSQNVETCAHICETLRMWKHVHNLETVQNMWENVNNNVKYICPESGPGPAPFLGPGPGPGPLGICISHCCSHFPRIFCTFVVAHVFHIMFTLVCTVFHIILSVCVLTMLLISFVLVFLVHCMFALVVHVFPHLFNTFNLF